MALNKSNGNMYEFITHTWNPLAGQCPHKCTYCSTNKLANRYEAIKNKYTGPIRVDEKQMKTNLGKENFIFVCAQNDLFAEGISNGIVSIILNHCCKYDSKYLFQTKNPSRILAFVSELPSNSVVCTTIESNRSFASKHHMLGASPWDRADAMNEITYEKIKTYVTVEPIMDFDLDDMVHYIETCLPEQVNIGADSGHNNLPEPSKEKILQLIERLEKFTKVVKKKNLDRILK